MSICVKIYKEWRNNPQFKVMVIGDQQYLVENVWNIVYALNKGMDIVEISKTSKQSLGQITKAEQISDANVVLVELKSFVYYLRVGQYINN